MARNIWKGKQTVDAGTQSAKAEGTLEDAVYPHTTGKILSTRREALGLSINDVSKNLRIRYPYLEAIEGNRFGELPGPTYSIGFVRGYSAYLGLDSEQLVDQFKRESGPKSGRKELILPTPLVEAQLPGKVVMVAAVLLAICIYSSWVYVSSKENTPRSTMLEIQQYSAMPKGDETVQVGTATGDNYVPNLTVTELKSNTKAPARLRSADGKEKGLVSTEIVLSSSTQPDNGIKVAVPTNVSEASRSNSEIAVPLVDVANSSTLQPVHQATDIVRQPVVYGAVNEDIRIVIQANSDSWVQITDVDHDLLLSRVLFAGDSFHVPNQPGLTMMTGNAGALFIKVDGEPVRKLGGRGVVLRDIKLDAERLKNNTAQNR